jgi:hypothetical protein
MDQSQPGHTSLTSLPIDLLLQILLLCETTRDLRALICSQRVLLNTYYSRRVLILTPIIRREVQDQALQGPHLMKYLDNTAHFICHDVATIVDDSIVVYEAVAPFMLCDPPSSACIAWTRKLCHLYTIVGPAGTERSLHLLEHHLEIFVSKHPALIDPDNPSSAFEARKKQQAPTPQEIEMCRWLARDYARLSRHEDCLRIQKSVFQRISPDAKTYCNWCVSIVKTFAALEDHDRALSYYQAMYTIYRTKKLVDVSLIWARQTILLHTSLNHVDLAIQHQTSVLTDLAHGSKEQIAWARQLIKMLKRAGQTEQALIVKDTTWQQMGVANACYYGWARELADALRRAGKGVEALAVVARMAEASQWALAAHPKDDSLLFHAARAEETLRAELAVQGWR